MFGHPSCDLTSHIKLPTTRSIPVGYVKGNGASMEITLKLPQCSTIEVITLYISKKKKKSWIIRGNLQLQLSKLVRFKKN